MFRNGKVDAPADYNGPREAVGIVSYLEKITGPASVELKTAKEVGTLLACMQHTHVCGWVASSRYKVLAPAGVALKTAEEVHTLSDSTWRRRTVAQCALASPVPAQAEKRID